MYEKKQKSMHKVFLFDMNLENKNLKIIKKKALVKNMEERNVLHIYNFL
jgi:hypothetical protein